jgi:hypothetical protein
MRRIDLKLKYLAVGCGHCGTGFVAQLLISAGIPCGHEHVFSLRTHHRKTEVIDKEVPLEPPPFGTPWEHIRAESGWPALYHMGHPCVKNSIIIHIVRNPLHVIRSFLYTSQNTPLGQIVKNRFIERNKIIEDSVGDREYILYQVETQQKLMDLIGVKIPATPFSDTKYNRHCIDEKFDITWDDIKKTKDKQLIEELSEMSERYGYRGCP